MKRRTRRAGAALAALLVLPALVAACTSESEPESPTADPSSSAPPTTEPPVPDEPASSQDLIAADLESGVIDIGTSLQLRAWALFADPRLPEQYDGAGSTGRDEVLHEDIAAGLDSLPADQRAELERYLLRPSDPDSPFSAQPALRNASDDGQRCSAPRQWYSQDWSPGGSEDLGFRAWACGPSRATVQGDLDAVLAVGSRLWGPMTAAAPGGMGRPVPDTGTRSSDGNGKTDIYLLEPLAECRDRGDACKKISGDAVAAAPKDEPRNCAVAGFPARGCSGYMIVGRGRLEGPAFAADFAHEFFHLLQHAHNGEISPTWYHEASAVWAEFHYEREAAQPEAYLRFENYQKENRSLLWYDRDSLVQYRAWGWPLFQAIERGPANVFATWRGIEQAITREDVDAAIDEKLGFADRFGDFAVRNAQPAAYIDGASTGLDDDRWRTKPGLRDFPPDPHLVTNARSPVILGTQRYAAEIDPLTAQYDEFEVTDEDVRQIVVDINRLEGASHAQLNVLGSLGNGSSWRRFPGRGGKVTLCRDTPGEDVSNFSVVVSNHSFARSGDLPDTTQRVKGGYTIEAKDECDPEEKYLAGHIEWQITKDLDLFVFKVSGRLELVLHETAPGTWTAERGGGSTYTYDVSIKYCQPDTSLSGVVESGVQPPEPDWHIANILTGQTTLDEDADLQILVGLYDAWIVTCTPPSITPDEYRWTGAGLAPGCGPNDQLLAEGNGVGGFAVDCETSSLHRTGHVSVRLHPIEGPQSPSG